ncbi:MAG: hypothetical protein NZ610_01935 [Candidatus Bipolaricaulota bacterium]|nr:hypothetical protein [Candidatus Bipolaricaulota bacterium]MDW8111647.1 hypothetical protein [Candidatus Bipolaricaulota bacterium]
MLRHRMTGFTKSFHLLNLITRRVISMVFITKQAGWLKSARSWGALGLILALAIGIGYGQEPRQIDVAALIALPPTPPLAEKLAALGLTHPDQLDEATQKLDAPARLLNFHAATPIDFSDIRGLGRGVYIPVVITKRDGGRPSLYFLSPGERVLVGAFLVGNGMMLRYITRVSGRTMPAQTGDVYREEWTNLAGQVVFQGEGRLEVTDPRTGAGRLSTVGSIAGLRRPTVCVWLFWSFILACETR